MKQFKKEITGNRTIARLLTINLNVMKCYVR